MEQTRVTQEMIDAYGEYTRLTFDRRAFMQKLQAMAAPLTQKEAIISISPSSVVSSGK